MAKGKYKDSQQYIQDPMEIERILIAKIADTGKEQRKKRRKAGLSSFYAQNGKIIEILPNNTTRSRQPVKSKWIVLEKSKRSVILK